MLPLLPVQTINVMNKQRLLVLKFTLVKKLFIPLIVHYQVLLNKTTNSVETPKSNPSNPSSSPIVEKSSSLATSSNTATTSTSTTTSIPPVTINVISGNIVTETPVVDQIQSTSTHNPQNQLLPLVLMKVLVLPLSQVM